MVDPDAPAPCWWIVRRHSEGRVRRLPVTHTTRADAMRQAQVLNNLVCNPAGLFNPNRNPGIVRYIVIGRHEILAYPPMPADS